jgi:hypothetical protein
MVVLGLGIVLILFAALQEYKVGPPKQLAVEITPETLVIGTKRPSLWLFYNDTDTNSRNWSDFMARSSNVINVPLLNICYETIVKQNGAEYRIEVIGGLQRVAELLGGWNALPNYMRNPKARVNVAEEDWIRAAILAKYGGLWLSPSVICLTPFGKLPTDKIVAFGQDDVPMYGSGVPGFRALWSPHGGHPVFVKWQKRARSRLDYQTGGRQVRGDAKTDWVELTTGLPEIEVRVKEELGRDPRTNKRLDLEQIFASGTEGRIPFTIPECAVYLPIPYDDLLNRRMFGWILRSSQEQIMESDLAIKYIIQKCV